MGLSWVLAAPAATERDGEQVVLAGSTVQDTQTQVLLRPSIPAVSTPAVRSYLAGSGATAQTGMVIAVGNGTAVHAVCSGAGPYSWPPNAWQGAHRCNRQAQREVPG